MTKHLIFFVHGMGTHKKGWSDPAWKILQEAAAGYQGLPKSASFNAKFQRVELVYDTVFENYRNRWKEDSGQLLSLLQQSGGTPPAVLDKVVKASATLGKDNFFTTHLLDVVMYRYLSLVRIPVRVTVAEQISAALVSAGLGDGADVKWSVISHSLGTSVAHDTLHYMFASGQSEIDVLSAEDFAPHCGLFVANVSRLLQESIDVYESLVRPSTNKAIGIFQYFLNAKHIYDPFIKPKPFAPASTWLDTATREITPSRFQSIELNEVLEKNVHALEHYLQNPKVHISLFRALYGASSKISSEEEEAAIVTFGQKAAAVKLDAVKAELLKLSESVGVDVDAFLNAADAFNTIIEF